MTPFRTHAPAGECLVAYQPPWWARVMRWSMVVLGILAIPLFFASPVIAIPLLTAAFWFWARRASVACSAYEHGLIIGGKLTSEFIPWSEVQNVASDTFGASDRGIHGVEIKFRNRRPIFLLLSPRRDRNHAELMNLLVTRSNALPRSAVLLDAMRVGPAMPRIEEPRTVEEEVPRGESETKGMTVL